jgi:hypothetical protein
MAFLHTLYHIFFLFMNLDDFIELKCVKRKANEIVTNVLLRKKIDPKLSHYERKKDWKSSYVHNMF